MKTVHRDDYGFEYKSKKSKNSKVREYRFAPVKEENSFNAEEVSFGKNAVAYRVQSKKYSYNYRDGILTVNQNIAREFSNLLIKNGYKTKVTKNNDVIIVMTEEEFVFLKLKYC